MKNEIVCDRCGARMNGNVIRAAQPTVEYCTIVFDEDDAREFSMGRLITLCPSCMIDFDSFMEGGKTNSG